MAAGEIYLYPTFLSTLSLRRATRMPVAPQPSHGYFYPRSPCGERRNLASTIVGIENFYPRSP